MGSSLVAAFCSTVVPAVEGEPTALMGVSAVDLGVPERMGPEAEQVLAAVLGPDFASLGIAERTARLNDKGRHGRRGGVRTASTQGSGRGAGVRPDQGRPESALAGDRLPRTGHAATDR